MRLWRIASDTYRAFDGEGARRYGARWTPRGLPAVYASATLSLAALERLVHTSPDLEVPDLVATPIDVPPDVAIDSVDVSDLPPDWRAYPAPDSLKALGGSWLQTGRSAILSVPSVIIPHERNYALNPRHPDFRRLKIGRAESFTFDPRLDRSKGERK